MTSGVIALMICAAVYIGVLFLNHAEKPADFTVVEGAIRLSQPQKDKPLEPIKKKKLKEVEPPKKLPKTFTSKPKNAQTKPKMSIATPQFSPAMLPGLSGDVSIPPSDMLGIGFTMEEVDEIPQILRSIQPEYPLGAKRSHTEGKVVIRMLVTSDGSPTRLTVDSATPPGIFDKAALSAAKRWKFRPGMYHGKAVDTWVLLPFNFKLQ